MSYVSRDAPFCAGSNAYAGAGYPFWVYSSHDGHGNARYDGCTPVAAAISEHGYPDQWEADTVTRCRPQYPSDKKKREQGCVDQQLGSPNVYQ